MTNTSSDTAIYVEIDALVSWESEMNSINENASLILENFSTAIKDLDNYWHGNSAEGFKNATTALIAVAKNKHNSMKNVSAFLNEVIVSIQNQ